MKSLAVLIGLLVVLLGGYWLFAKGGAPSPIVETLPYGESTPVVPNTQPQETLTEGAPIETPQDTDKNVMNATLHTNKGDITIELFGNVTPNTVTNFVKLARDGFYNGTKFHRVIKDFMIQGGDPLSKDDAQMARWGTGGPGYTFADEITTQNKNVAGTISMANAGPNTNGSQFFINTKDNGFLDPKHTVFGKVTEGLDVVMAIGAMATGPNDRPVEPIIITSVELK